MAKKLVKKAAPGASKKTKPAPKPSAAKPAARGAASAKFKTKPVAASKKPIPVTKAKAKGSVPSKPTPVAKPAAKSVEPKTKPAANVVAAAAKNGKPVVITAKPVVANGKSTVVNGKAAKVEIAKPAPKVGKAEAKPAKNDNAVVIAPKVEPNKTGRPQLLQGPIAIRPMGKKATLPPTPPKPAVKPVKKRAPASDEPKFVVVQPPTKAVATSEKAVKNKAGLSQKDLEFFRDLLLAKRRELLGDMNSMEREALRENSTDLSNLPVHMADQGTDAYEQEFTLHLVEKDRGLLRELNEALAKIQNGTYGICEGTGLPISKPRLEAQPWARYSIEHARALEKRQMMFRR